MSYDTLISHRKHYNHINQQERTKKRGMEMLENRKSSTHGKNGEVDTMKS